MHSQINKFVRAKSISKPICLLHLGTHKTGTSALQKALHSNRQALLKAGWLYPDLKEFCGASQVAHHRFFRRLHSPERGLTFHECEQLRNEWCRMCRDQNIGLILSAESLCFHPSPDLAPVTSWRVVREKYLRMVRELLEGFNILPILVLRRQDTFIESLYREWVFRGFHCGTESFADFRRVMTPYYANYGEQIEAIESVFNRVQVLSYWQLSQAPDYAGDFLRSLGIQPPGMSMTQHVRRSFSPIVTELKRQLNCADHPFACSKKFKRLCAQEVFQGWIQSQTGSVAMTCWESFSDRRAYLTQFCDENLRLSKKSFFGEGAFPGESILNQASMISFDPVPAKDLVEEFCRVFDSRVSGESGSIQFPLNNPVR